MTIPTLSLPRDIPWRRLCVSEDMIDATYGERTFPARWRSSVAVFSYEPPDGDASPEAYAGRRITYLKVSCSVTGFQPNGRDLQLAEPSLDSRWRSEFVANYRNTIGRYYPCYAALLQVAVFPNPHELGGSPVPLHDFPYIMDFEPKKREMYESATEGQEFLSASRSAVNLRKGTTTTESTEHTAKVGGGLKVGDVGIGGNYQYKTGTSTESVDMTTADYGQEKRETYSYSTSLSHMYHLFNGYHLGTNRALFLMQPRPHISDTEVTFANGPRKLEGIQEVVLIVNAPKKIPGLCVEVNLETAHLKIDYNVTPRIIPREQLFVDDNIQKTAHALGLYDDPQFNYAVYEWDSKVGEWNGAPVSDRIKVAAGKYKVTNATDPHDYWQRLHTVFSANPDIGVGAAAVLWEQLPMNTGAMYVTGRTTSCCVGLTAERPSEVSVAENVSARPHPGEYLAYEAPIVIPRALAGRTPSKDRLLAANSLSATLGERLVESIGSLDRYPTGTRTFEHSRLVRNALKRSFRHMTDDDARNVPVERMTALPADLLARIRRQYAGMRIRELILAPADQIEADLGITEGEARDLQMQLIRAALSEAAGPR